MTQYNTQLVAAAAASIRNQALTRPNRPVELGNSIRPEVLLGAPQVSQAALDTFLQGLRQNDPELLKLLGAAAGVRVDRTREFSPSNPHGRDLNVYSADIAQPVEKEGSSRAKRVHHQAFFSREDFKKIPTTFTFEPDQATRKKGLTSVSAEFGTQGNNWLRIVAKKLDDAGYEIAGSSSVKGAQLLKATAYWEAASGFRVVTNDGVRATFRKSELTETGQDRAKSSKLNGLRRIDDAQERLYLLVDVKVPGRQEPVQIRVNFTSSTD